MQLIITNRVGGSSLSLSLYYVHILSHNRTHYYGMKNYKILFFFVALYKRERKTDINTTEYIRDPSRELQSLFFSSLLLRLFIYAFRYVTYNMTRRAFIPTTKCFIVYNAHTSSSFYRLGNFQAGVL